MTVRLRELERLREIAFTVHKMADGLFLLVKMMAGDTMNPDTLNAAINTANNARALATRLELDANALEAS